MSKKNFFITLFSVLKSLTKKERFFLVILFLVILASLGTKSFFAIKERGTMVPVRGGSFAEGIVGQPTAINPLISNNPADQDISALVYSNLKNLAADIKVNENKTEYTVRFFDDLRWSDGEPITSDDVVFTVETAQNPELASPLAKNWQGVGVERISELQIKLTIPAPFVFFEQNMERLAVLPKHIFGNVPAPNIRLSSFNLEPISSGPYKFKEFKQKRDGFISSYILVPNENYHEELPFIERFEFVFFENRNNLLEAFRAGEIDGFGTASPLPDLKQNLPKTLVKEIPMPKYYALFFNPRTNSILNNKEIRLLLDESIDRKILAEEILGGLVYPINEPAGTGLERLPQEYKKPDKESIAERINEIIKEEESDSLEVQILVPDIEIIKTAAQFIKEEWESVGANVFVVSLSAEEFVTGILRERSYEAVIFGHSLENVLDIFPFWHSSERFYPGLNLSLYNNENVDGLLEKIRQEEDVAERERAFLDSVELIKNDTRAVFLFTVPYNYFYKEKLGDFNAGRIITTPSERFRNIASWYVREARVIEGQ